MEDAHDPDFRFVDDVGYDCPAFEYHGAYAAFEISAGRPTVRKVTQIAAEILNSYEIVIGSLWARRIGDPVVDLVEILPRRLQENDPMRHA